MADDVWISVEAALPREHSVRFLVVNPRHRDDPPRIKTRVAIASLGFNGLPESWQDECGQWVKVSHWRELPELPGSCIPNIVGA